jgi:hypothetical protein
VRQCYPHSSIYILCDTAELQSARAVPVK